MTNLKKIKTNQLSASNFQENISKQLGKGEDVGFHKITNTQISQSDEIIKMKLSFNAFKLQFFAMKLQ